MRSGPIVLMISLCFFLAGASRIEQIILGKYPNLKPVPKGMIRCKPTACCPVGESRCCYGGDWCCLNRLTIRVIAHFC
ncbi:unnamed protein product [Nezara viridula]|uniref:Neuropeptide n=1 Tax=Nezara viridula TaxID=85310 RepID=A0A9P0MSR8_NEZVI|nr:unnamed protein product [Nezara viridula]